MIKSEWQNKGVKLMDVEKRVVHGNSGLPLFWATIILGKNLTIKRDM